MLGDGGLEGRTILVVEDEFLILMDLQAQLEEAGAAVVTARDLSEGMARLQASDPDAIDGAILDIRLSDGEVFPLAERLRARGIPVLFHSGHAKADDLEARFPGCIALSKPVPETQMLASIRQVMETAAA